MQSSFECQAFGARWDAINELIHVARERAILRTLSADIAVDRGPFFSVDLLQERLQISGNTGKRSCANSLQRDLVKQFICGIAIQRKRESRSLTVHVLVEIVAFDETQINERSVTVGEFSLQ